MPTRRNKTRAYERSQLWIGRIAIIHSINGATKGLELLDVLSADARLANHHRLNAVRANLLELAGDRAGAIRNYRAAASRTASLPERNYLLAQAAKLSSEP